MTSPHFTDAPLPLLPLRHGVVLPGAVTSLPIGRPKSRALAESLQPGDIVVLANQRDSEMLEPDEGDLHRIAVAARVRQKQDRGSRGHVLVVEALGRVNIERIVARDPYLSGFVTEAKETRGDDAEARLLSESIRAYVKDATTAESGAAATLDAARSPSAVADALGTFLDPDDAGKVRVLETLDVVARLRLVRELFAEAKARIDLKTKIETEVRKDLSDNQKQAILRQQLRAIQRELGEDEDDPITELRSKLDAASLPEEARKVADRELRRLEGMGQQQAEAHVIRTYLEWIAELPWNTRAPSRDDLDAVARASTPTITGSTT